MSEQNKEFINYFVWVSLVVFVICRQPFLAVTRAAFSGQSGPYFAASF